MWPEYWECGIFSLKPDNEFCWGGAHLQACSLFTSPSWDETAAWEAVACHWVPGDSAPRALWDLDLLGHYLRGLPA